MAAAVQGTSWVSLNTPPQELVLSNTLVTGQSFRWRRMQDSSSPYESYMGVIGQRLVHVRQLPDDVQYKVLARSPGEEPAADAAAIHDYFNLGTSLTQLSRQWASQDPRYALIAPALPGCRMLRQDPVECLFQFICSSNNHISRIHGMVERLCSTYGSPLVPHNYDSALQQQADEQQQQQNTASSLQAVPTMPCTPEALAIPAAISDQQQHSHHLIGSSTVPLPFQQPGPGENVLQQHTYEGQQHPQPGVLVGEPGQQELQLFYTFPTLQQLSAATEEALRAAGFGYRAKFIVGSVQQLLEQPEGGVSWLLGLRDKPYAEAHEALCSLPGVGPKVAACICLFALDKHDAIPVDTHVWTLATRYYATHLAKKSLTPKLHAEVQQAFVDRFGPYAGWAHNCLFISELASHRPLLPPDLSSSLAAGSKAASAASKKRKAVGLPAEEIQAAVGAGGTHQDISAGSMSTKVSSVALGTETPAAVETMKPSGSAVRRRRRRPLAAQHWVQPGTEAVPVMDL